MKPIVWGLGGILWVSACGPSSAPSQNRTHPTQQAGEVSPGLRSQPAAAIPVDGHWWLARSSSEREGFLIGFTDCYSNDKKRDMYLDVSIEDAVDSVTHYFESSPSKLSGTVAAAILHVDSLQRAIRKKPVTKTDYWDGDAWNGLGRDRQIGIVEGLTDGGCAVVSDRAGTPGLTAAEIRARLNVFYGIDTTTSDLSEVNRDRARIRIADAARRVIHQK